MTIRHNVWDQLLQRNKSWTRGPNQRPLEYKPDALRDWALLGRPFQGVRVKKVLVLLYLYTLKTFFALNPDSCFLILTMSFSCRTVHLRHMYTVKIHRYPLLQFLKNLLRNFTQSENWYGLNNESLTKLITLKRTEFLLQLCNSRQTKPDTLVINILFAEFSALYKKYRRWLKGRTALKHL